jgi:iron-sulfur cluster assembly accessory protein
MTIQTFDPKTSMVTMTPDAAAHIRRQLIATGRNALRLAVTESGCSGYMYELGYTDTAADTDLVCEVAPGVRVLIDAEVLPLVRGTQIDYVREGLNAALKFRNPNAEAQCGCGESFSVNKAATH